MLLNFQQNSTNSKRTIAFIIKVLVQDEAKPKYPGSNTLYSEDGKYTFTQDSNGRYRMNLIDDSSDGASLDDIANWMMSGTPNRNIETKSLFGDLVNPNKLIL